MTPTNELDLDAIEVMANDATRGPWHVEYLGGDGGYPQRIANDAAVIVAETFEASGGDRESTPEFIAAARTIVPLLVAEVRRLRTELASREPQILAEEPGADVTEVYDHEGHPWERNRNTGLWCAFGVDCGVPTSWESLARVWGPITVKGAGR